MTRAAMLRSEGAEEGIASGQKLRLERRGVSAALVTARQTFSPMNPIPSSIHDRKVFPTALLVAVAVLAALGHHSFAQSKPAADSAALPQLPYGVSRQESIPGRSAELTPPLRVTELPGDSRNPPATSAKSTATPQPRDPLWDSPDANSVGVESAEALHRKYHLPANPNGTGQASPIGWLSLLGLLGLAAVAVVLSQHERGRGRKVGRRAR